ncbi:TetR/AcrR family transcriptional regulator [Oceanobacillus sp. J11TS1]|uniref:TetR/AcrR family transcriptional regulator n=1 Tax=Oceanobacillus sp. J11TS1 TaxID=2807191 RepID=UPI001B2283B4|nr:TetR/AcrR family transcriptional regulator [Oceanobacillus sp. J11TS1]GIO25339.1 TetR family transcriptional regulator [Oceanobacillus sp. J11TS1]
MSKKLDLLEAASRVILDKGVNRLTLNAVAQEANVSKGGLLYHYATKDELIKGMNLHVIAGFRKLIEKHVADGYSYHEAYLITTLDSLKKDSTLMGITTSLLASISTNRELLNLWREEYKYLNEKLSEEDYKLEYSLLVKSVCDGLWYSKLFEFGHIDQDDEQKVIDYLLELLKGRD